MWAGSPMVSACFRDSEPEVHATADHIRCQADARRGGAAAGAIEAAEIYVQVFGFHAPVPGQRDLDARPDRPTGVRVAGRADARNARVQVSDRKPSGEIR